jgi:hypothetical protein
LNPIEHLWDQLDKHVHIRQPAPQTLLQLQQALQEEWQRIPQVKINQGGDELQQFCKQMVVTQDTDVIMQIQMCKTF